MKTKFSKLTILVTFLLLGLSNCSNNEEIDGGGSNEAKSIYLKITSESPLTYGDGVPVSNATPVVFSSGYLYFTNASGAILAYYTLTSSDTDIDTGGTNIKLGDIQLGKTISNLPGQVSAVHVVGNSSGLPTTGNISAVKAVALQASSQGTLSSVNLYGTNTLTLVSGNNYTCAITLKPTVARIELTNITSSGVITGFQVDGIFIDNYYSQATVGGTVVVGNLVNNGSVAATFTDNSLAYPTAAKTFLYDYYSSGLIAQTKIAKPATSGNVWGYNLFGNTAGSGSFAVPRIIIRLSNITTSDASTYTSPQFITVKGLKSSGTSLTSLDAGKIYNIGAGALTFKESDLAPIPNVSAINVTVTVTLATWSVVAVTPEL
ncbi:MAG: hypothetical protein ACK5KT_09220 [Dysgonomonas sp.]